jgi:carboxymethylenebutenolidase
VPGAGSGPGLVLFHDLLDDDRDLRELSEFYAEEGYLVFCPKAFAVARGAGDVLAAVAALRGRAEVKGKVGALGFGLGGKLAYLAEAGVDCAVSYYGFGIDFGLNFASRIACPLALHFAENDPQIPPGAVTQIQEAFAGHPDVAIYVYPGAAPGFACHAAASYDNTAAGLVHSRSIGLLRRVLEPPYDLEAL